MNEAKRESGKSRKLDLTLGILALVTIIAAWYIGDAIVDNDVFPHLIRVVPEAERFNPLPGDAYEAFKTTDGQEELIAFLSVGEADGYGGPLAVVTGVDLQGVIIGFSVTNHKETPSYFDRITASDMYGSLAGKSVTERFVLGDDIDSVTSATYSARAVAGAVKRAGRKLGTENLGMEMPAEELGPPHFGIPEIAVIVLFLVGLPVLNRKIKYHKQIRWVSMILGLVVIGFMFNFPLTISRVNSLLLGYLPDWRFDLFWIILLVGIIASTLLFKKNPYCQNMCPFGAAQECLGAIGGAKSAGSTQQKAAGKWIKRGLTWAVIMLALIFRNPAIGSYEVFGGLFSLTATTIQFILLISVLLASLFLRRPWCNYLCPLDPVMDFLIGTRKTVVGIWQKKEKKSAV